MRLPRVCPCGCARTVAAPASAPLTWAGWGRIVAVFLLGLACLFLGMGCAWSDAVVAKLRPDLVKIAESAQAAALANGATQAEVEAAVNAAVEKWSDAELTATVTKATADAAGHAINGNLPLALGDMLGLLLGGGALFAGRKRGFAVLTAAGKAIRATPAAPRGPPTT